jgi:hypothetical protein
MSEPSKSFKEKLFSQLFYFLILLIIVGVVAVLAIISFGDEEPKPVENLEYHHRSNTLRVEFSGEKRDADIGQINQALKMIEEYHPTNLSSPLGITGEANSFRGLAMDVSLFMKKYSSDTSFTNKIGQINSALIRKQSTYFPILREAYSKVASKTTKDENNVVVWSVSGNGHTTLEAHGD